MRRLVAVVASFVPFDTAWIVPGVLVGLAGLIALGRALSTRRVVTAYVPPASVRAGEAGVLIDGRVDAADVVATVVDLARRGHLRLEQARAAGDHDIMVTVARPWLHDRELRPFEVALLAHVFTDGVQSARLSALRGYGESATSIKDNLSNDLTTRGFFSAAPRAVRRFGVVSGWIAFGVWMQVAWNSGALIATVFPALVAAGAWWWLLHLLCVGRPTAQGRQAQQQLRGYADYLRRVEKDRLDRLTPGTLDEHLPWAIALGVSDGWLA
jgi:hypothetical protein